MRLFSPYWRTISINIVKDVQSRPQIAQYMCDLLNIKVPEFLSLTQTSTIPYLILTKKRDLLQRVAESCSPACSIETLCMKPQNMAAILSYLLLRSSVDVEGMAMTLLSETSPDFANCDLGDLIRIEPILTVTELLKAAGEEDESQKPRVCQIYLHLIIGRYCSRHKGLSSTATRDWTLPTQRRVR